MHVEDSDVGAESIDRMAGKGENAARQEADQKQERSQAHDAAGSTWPDTELKRRIPKAADG